MKPAFRIATGSDERTSAYLDHYGVKGMKWGVIRTPEQLGHHRIPKGTKMYTTRLRKDEPTSGVLQVSYEEPDRARQRGIYAKTGLRSHEKTFEAKEDINIPSRKELRQVVNDVALHKVGELLAKDSAKAATDYGLGEEMVNFWSRNNATVDEMIDYVIDYQMALPNVQKAVISELKNRGYNAMVDEGLLGTSKKNQQGMDPLIIFDADKTLGQVNQKSLSPFAQRKSQRNYDTWRARAYLENRKNNNQW